MAELLGNPPLLALVLFATAAYFWVRKQASALPLPPGPKPNWLGNVDLPKIRPWLTYAQWGHTYGDVIYLHVFSNPILVLNSAEAISDLFERRSANYSSRPRRTMVVDLIGWDWLVSSFPYGPKLSDHRVLFLKHLPSAREPSSMCQSLQIRETHEMCRNLLATPEAFRYHIRTMAAAVVLKLTYGLSIESGDAYISLADRAMSSLAQAGIFGSFLVDYLPWLKHAPSWMSFRRKASEWRKPVRTMLESPFAAAKKAWVEGTATDCLVSVELESGTKSEETIKNVAATMYAAGADTVVSGISSFFLVMLLHPELQETGRREIDRVIGKEQRLPLYSDRSQLPFIDYICYEILRWNPVTPLGLARTVTVDDMYRGYRVPKGTTILPNVWAVLHDENVYPDPLTFNPYRFAPENRVNGLNPIPEPAFGFGRRLCPGKYLAFDTLWMAIATVLAVFDVSRETGEDGKCAELNPEFTAGLISHPLPFPCKITPRSEKHRQLIVQTELWKN